MEWACRFLSVTNRFHGDGNFPPARWHNERLGSIASLRQQTSRNSLGDNPSRSTVSLLFTCLWALVWADHVISSVDGSWGETCSHVQPWNNRRRADALSLTARLFPKMVVEEMES